MDSLEISVLVVMGAYILAMVGIGFQASKSQSHEEFAIGSRNVGYVPTIGSLAASFRDGSGIVIWVGFGFTIGYGGIWLMLGVLTALGVYTVFGSRVRRRALENDSITVGELVRTSIGPFTEKMSAGLILFFSLLVVAVQLHVSGNLLAEIIDLHNWIGVVSVAIVVGVYLIFGGYSTVMKTDVIQFFMILSLVAIPFLAVAPDTELFKVSSLQTLPVLDRTALFLIGFFFMLSAADVWQKLFAARHDNVIKIGFPLSGVFLIIMTLSLIWLGMTAKDLLAGQIEDSSALFQIFDQRIFPTWLLAFITVVFMAITMSTLDTSCYLFASSLAKNFVPKKTELRSDYVRFSKFAIVSVLIVTSILALTISDAIQFAFNAVSLLLILAPLYIAVGFGWNVNSTKLDIGASLAILASAGIYLIMFVQGSFENMIMLTVPVLISSLLFSILFLYNRSQRVYD